MASLGSFVLLATFVVASYALAASVAGGRRRSKPLIDSGIGAFYLTAALMSVASAILIQAFVTGNYAIKYVQRYSDSAQPLAYRITSYWGGLDGSIMFWVFLLSVFGTIAVAVNRERHRELIPWVVAIIATTEMFFIFIMVVHNNPFETFIASAPTDGRGLNPLLQNFYMAIHPPSLYTGLVAMTIPYAFGMAALITGHLDDAWLRAVRRWTMIGWLFLSFGLTLGMLWAYEELGWGGFWGWDPVENAGLLPWFTATAFLHSVMVQERRGMLRVWNVTLVIVTFFLTIFGTFMTRSGVVQSVHAFGEDKWLAGLFSGFMVVILVFSFGMVIYRLPLLKSRHELDSWVSREAAFLANNWILLFSAFFVLFATMFPTLSEALRGHRLTVGPPFFNTWMRPIGLALLVLTGTAPLLAWRKSSITNLLQSLAWPAAGAAATAIAVTALGVRVWSSGICFALCAFVGVTILQEFIRGAAVRRETTGSDYFTAMIGLVARSRRRYGGYIVHLGIVLMFLGFAGQGYKREEHLKLNPGQQGTVGRFTIRHNGVGVTSDEQKQMITGHITVFQGDKEVGELEPARWFFVKHEERADHRGGDAPRRRRGSLRRARRLRGRDAERDLRDHHQPAGELDLARLRRAGVRDGDCAPPGAGFPLRRGEAAGRRGDDRADAALAPASGPGLRAAFARADDGCRHPEDAARARAAARDHLHVPRLRPPAPGRLPVPEGGGDAGGAGRPGRERHDPRAGLRLLHGAVRQRRTAGLADQQRTERSRVAAAVRRGAVGRRDARVGRRSLDPSRCRDRGACAGRRECAGGRPCAARATGR